MKSKARLASWSEGRIYLMETAARRAHNRWLRTEAPWYWRLFTNLGFFNTTLRFVWDKDITEILCENYIGLVVNEQGIPFADIESGFDWLSRKGALSLLGIDEETEEDEMNERCRCYDIEDAINTEFPEANWNMDEGCKAWQARSAVLKDNNIEHARSSDECYGCTCPTYGRMICNWCV